MRAVAVNVVVHATFTVAADGAMVILAIGASTVTVAVPVFPSMVALIVTVPAETPVTTPDEFTVARLVLLLDHVATRRYRGCPAASSGVAVSVVVLPTITLAVEGDTVTLATGTIFTVNVADACKLSTLTSTMPVPDARAVTSPLELTLVMPGVLVDQVTVRPLSDRICPLAFRGTAVSWRG